MASTAKAKERQEYNKGTTVYKRTGTEYKHEIAAGLAIGEFSWIHLR